MLQLVIGRGNNPPRYGIVFPCAAGGTSAQAERTALLTGKYETWANRHEEQASQFEFVVGPMGFYARPNLNGSAVSHYPQPSELALWLGSLLASLKPEPVYHTHDLPGHIWVPCDSEREAEKLAEQVGVLAECCPGRLLRRNTTPDHWGVVVDVETPAEAQSLMELIDRPLNGVRGWANGNTYQWQ